MAEESSPPKLLSLPNLLDSAANYDTTESVSSALQARGAVVIASDAYTVIPAAMLWGSPQKYQRKCDKSSCALCRLVDDILSDMELTGELYNSTA